MGYIVDWARSLASLTLSQFFDIAFTALVFVLGYRLLIVGLERLPAGEPRPTLGEHVRLLGPGAIFSLLGTTFLLRNDPALLYLLLVTLAIGAGLGAIGLGCALLVKALSLGEDSPIWEDRRILLTRSAPGVFMTVAGLITTVIAIWVVPGRLADDRLERREVRQEVVNAIHTKLDEASALVDHKRSKP